MQGSRRAPEPRNLPREQRARRMRGLNSPVFARHEAAMRLKISVICPACQAAHPEEVEPGTKLTCPECDEVYRAEAPEVAPSTAKSRAAAKKSSSGKKKSRARKGGDLGKLIERFAPHQQRAMSMAV